MPGVGDGVTACARRSFACPRSGRDCNGTISGAGYGVKLDITIATYGVQISFET